MNIFLNLPPYLRDWMVNQYKNCAGNCASDSEGNRKPVLEFRRGSIESSILLTGLRPIRSGETPMALCPPGWTVVKVPVFRGVDLSSRNYLPVKSRIAIEKAILRQFDLDLWNLVSHAQFRLAPLNETIEGWMDARGIEDSEQNTWAVCQRALRLRKRYENNLRQRKFQKKKKEEKDNE